MRSRACSIGDVDVEARWTVEGAHGEGLLAGGLDREYPLATAAAHTAGEHGHDGDGADGAGSGCNGIPDL